MRMLLAIAVSTAALACAQAKPDFEVASIRPSQPAAQGGQVKVNVSIDGAQARFTYFSLKDLIGAAYNLKEYQIEGPEFIASERYDIVAKIPEGTRRDQLTPMLQTLLEDRFKLKSHRTKKDFPVYALIVNKGGLKIKESAPDPDADGAANNNVNVNVSGGRGGVFINYGGGASFNFADNKLICKRLTMEMIASTLARFVDRPVVDMTGLSGNYDLTLEFTPEDYRSLQIRAAITAGVQLPLEVRQLAEGASNDSLFSGMQAAGLKLDSRKSPLDVLVVDHAEKNPSGN